MLKRKKGFLQFNKTQSTIILASLAIFVLSVAAIGTKLHRPTTNHRATLTADSYDDCLKKGGEIIKKSKEFETDKCVLDGWEYSWSPTKTPTVDYTFELEYNQFITLYNQVNPLSFTLNIPSQCEVLLGNEPLYKYIECDYDSHKITIKPTEGGRGFSSEQVRDNILGKSIYGGHEWNSQLYIFNDQAAFATYAFTHPKTNDYYLMTVNYEVYSDMSAKFVDNIFSTMKFGQIVNRIVVN